MNVNIVNDYYSLSLGIAAVTFWWIFNQILEKNLFNEIQFESINRKVQISLFKTHLFILEEFHRNQKQTYTANQNRKRLHLSSIRKSSGHLAQFLKLSSRVLNIVCNVYPPSTLYFRLCIETWSGRGGGVVSEQKVFRHKSIYKYRDIEQKWWKQKIKLTARTAGPAVTKIF